jgi:PAS domain S-box-containing protein
MAKKIIFEKQGQKLEGTEKRVSGLNLREEALRESEEKSSAILESIEDGYYEVDLAGNFTFFNDSMAKIMGYSKNELLGMNNQQYMDEFNAKRVFRAFSKVYTTEIPTKAFDWELIRKDGSKCFVEASVSLEKDSDNCTTGFFGIARDITKRKLVDKALRESEENYRNIIESIEDGYYEVDLAGNFTFCNDPMARIMGYSKNELMGMNNRQYMDEFNAKRVFRTFSKVYTTGIPTKAFDWELIRKDGSKCFAETSVSLKKDLIGRPIGFFGIARDITERKLLNETLRKNEKELEMKTKNLEEVNTALKVLLKRREEDKTELEEHLEKVKERALGDKLKDYLAVLETNLNTIISPFTHRLSSKYLNLSSAKIEVANFVKHGKSTKEIADLLNLSTRTIECHRDNIREKIGIKNKKVALRTYLLSIQ